MLDHMRKKSIALPDSNSRFTTVIKHNNNKNNKNATLSTSSLPGRIEEEGNRSSSSSNCNSSSSSSSSSSYGTRLKEEKKAYQHTIHILGTAKQALFGIIRRCWSITFILVIILVSSLCITGYGIWLVNYLMTTSAVNDVSLRGRDALLVRIHGQLDVYFAVGPRVARTMYHEFKMAELLGLNISTPNPNNLFDGEAAQMQLVIFASFVNSSHLQGVFYSTASTTCGLVRDTRFSGRSRFNLNNGYPNGTLTMQPIDIRTLEKQPISFVTHNVSMADRNCYKKPAATQTMRWSSTYISISAPYDVVLALGVPYFDSNHVFKGVLSAHFGVVDVSDFLKSIPTQRDARALVVETDLIIVGSSIGESVVPGHPGKPERLNAQNHSDYVVRETAGHILARHTLPVSIPIFSRDEFNFKDSRGKVRIVVVAPYRDAYGIDWLTVVILSESVVLKSVRDSTRISLIISSSAIVAAMVIALLLGCCITRPLVLIANQMRRLANMDMGRVKKISYMKLYEINEIVSSMHNMESGLRSFEQYVPSDVVRALVQQKKTAKLGVIPRRLTIMFVQLISNVKFFDVVEPMVVIQVLQDYFTALSELIIEHSGVVDKYMGESIMALFNAPVTVQDHEVKAVAAANAMHAKMSELNERWKCKNYPTLEIIIGINTAKCLVGNIGSHDRVSYTALGDGVNVASRLNSLNKRYKTEIIIGPETYESVKLIAACRWLARVCVKGKREALDIYEVLCDLDKATDEQSLLSTLSLDIKCAIERKDLNSARMAVGELVRMKPGDLAGLELQNRLNQDSFSNILTLCVK